MIELFELFSSACVFALPITLPLVAWLGVRRIKARMEHRATNQLRTRHGVPRECIARAAVRRDTSNETSFPA